MESEIRSWRPLGYVEKTLISQYNRGRAPGTGRPLIGYRARCSCGWSAQNPYRGVVNTAFAKHLNTHRKKSR